MIDLKECLDRSVHGPILRERDFDLGFAQTVRRLCSDYAFEYDADQVIPGDTTADKVFEAGVDLLAETGLYNKDSQRVIQFQREEILDLAKSRQREFTLGTGKDAVLVRERKPDSDFPPVIVTGPVGGPLTDEYFLPCHLSYAQEPTCQGLLGGVLLSYDGVENMPGRPNELIVCRGEGKLLNQAAIDAGKPGLFVGPFPPGGISPEAIFSGWSAERIAAERTAIPIQVMPELKINWSKLNLALFCQYHGILPWLDVAPVIGGFCRTPVEAAITQTATAFASWAFTGGSNSCVWSTDIEGICTRKRNLWTHAATTRALERHVGNPVFLLGYASAGPCTEMVLLETAAYTVSYTASGGELIWGGASSNGIDVNASAGLQGRMIGETAQASCAIGTDKANEIINKLFSTFEEDLPTAPKGKTFPECYDLATLEPTREYSNLYAKTKERLSSDFGISYAD